MEIYSDVAGFGAGGWIWIFAVERTRAGGADVDGKSTESQFAYYFFFGYFRTEAGRSASILRRSGNNPGRSRRVSGGDRKHSPGDSSGCGHNRLY
jgi:hypothetical protein